MEEGGGTPAAPPPIAQRWRQHLASEKDLFFLMMAWRERYADFLHSSRHLAYEEWYPRMLPVLEDGIDPEDLPFLEGGGDE